MDISADKAYWFLQYHFERSSRLYLCVWIAGEEASCDTVITSVDRDFQLAAVELIADDGSQVWQRIVPLRSAEFSLFMFGDPDFGEWEPLGCHSVLALRYPDSTKIFFAERV